MHKFGQMSIYFGVGWMILSPILLGMDKMVAMIYGVICVIGGLVFGLNKRQAVCSACKKVLLAENPL